MESKNNPVDQRVDRNPATLVTPIVRYPFLRSSRGQIATQLPRKTKEEHMCPACIASTAVLVAGVGSAGGILAVCIGKFRKFFRAKDK